MGLTVPWQYSSDDVYPDPTFLSVQSVQINIPKFPERAPSSQRLLSQNRAVHSPILSAWPNRLARRLETNTTAKRKPAGKFSGQPGQAGKCFLTAINETWSLAASNSGSTLPCEKLHSHDTLQSAHWHGRAHCILVEHSISEGSKGRSHPTSRRRV